MVFQRKSKCFQETVFCISTLTPIFTVSINLPFDLSSLLLPVSFMLRLLLSMFPLLLLCTCSNHLSLASLLLSSPWTVPLKFCFSIFSNQRKALMFLDIWVSKIHIKTEFIIEVAALALFILSVRRSSWEEKGQKLKKQKTQKKIWTELKFNFVSSRPFFLSRTPLPHVSPTCSFLKFRVWC